MNLRDMTIIREYILMRGRMVRFHPAIKKMSACVSGHMQVRAGHNPSSTVILMHMVILYIYENTSLYKETEMQPLVKRVDKMYG